MMKICASVGDPKELQNVSNADLVEIRLDVFDSVPETIEKPVVIKITDRKQLEIWKDPVKEGYLDIGEHLFRPYTELKIISSVHDTSRTPDGNEIADKLNSFKCDLAKGVYTINRPADLISLYEASKLVKKPHILLGMGEMGVVTRMRPKVLGNEFTYAHTGTPTAPGQLSTEDMKGMDDDCLLLGLIGHPLSHSASKKMMMQAMADCGMKGYYLNFDISSLEFMDEVIRKYDIKGVNVTLPYKNDILIYLDKIDQTAEKTGAVNTVLNAGSQLIGSNTDLAGANFAVKRAGVEIDSGMKVLVMGSGGVARSCIYLMSQKGAEVSVIGRNHRTVTELCSKFGCTAVDNKDPSGYDMIINCTPIGMYSDEKYPIDIENITGEQIIFDVTYSKESPIRNVADARGCKRISGLDMLIGQGMHSFKTWTGKDADYESLRRSIT